MIRLLVLLLALALPVSAVAQNATERTRHFVFVFPDGARGAVEPLMERADRTLEQIGRRLGALDVVTAGPPFEVNVASNREDFFAAQPSKGLDTWVAGTAYPAQGLIILSTAPDQFFSLPEIFRHEIAHVALYRAAGDRFMPRWLDEGLAILLAGETVAGRLEAAAGAALSGRLIPLADLERGFPAEDAAARLAYAESVLFLRYLQRHHAFDARLGDLLARVRGGSPFPVAFEATFGSPVAPLEAAFFEGLRDSSGWLALLSTTDLLWVAGALIIVYAWWRLRRRKRLKLQRMAIEDRLADEDDEPWPPTPLVLPDRPPPDLLPKKDDLVH
ncbi:MAG: hypothetical protein AMXMBFR64_47520 [Myxococcales bacterium]